MNSSSECVDEVDKNVDMVTNVSSKTGFKEFLTILEGNMLFNRFIFYLKKKQIKNHEQNVIT